MGSFEPPLSDRASAVTPSVTLTITAKAKKMKAKGLDVINLAAGEPDFNTPDFIIDAAIQAMREGKTKYTPAVGLPAFREKISRKLSEENGLSYDPQQIVVGVGAKHSLYTLLQAILNPGDRIILPDPCWVSYKEMALLTGAEPIFVPTKAEDKFALHREDLEKAVTADSKVILINSPSNPTGAVYDMETLKMVADFAVAHNLLIISDEIYEKLVYTDTGHLSIGSISQEVLGRTVTVNGLSKSHSMTGWRIGYAAGPLSVMQAVGKIQSHSTSNATSFCQWASIAALDDESDLLEKNLEIFRKRRDLIHGLISKLEGVSCFMPDGAFYLFPDVSSWYGKEIQGRKINSSLDFCEHLLDTELVAAVPGVAFGADSCIRVSYATSESELEKAAKRIESFLRG